jgi:hypothetical protein
MQHYWIKKTLIAFTILSSMALTSPPCEASNQNIANGYVVSPNVPLNSYVYDYLEKLDGLGYLDAMLTGSKPYTRLQTATYIHQISVNMNPSLAPRYACQMLRELTKDFKQELSVLNQTKPADKISLKEISLGESYYKGDTLQQKHTKSNYQPLHINDNGNKYAPHANEIMSLRYEGNINKDFSLSFTPQLIYNNTDTHYSMKSAYIKTHLNNVSVQVGKDAMWWGQGYRGSLLLTNNAVPQTSIKINNIEPMKFNGLLSFLGQTNTTCFYSILEDNRTDIKYPSFVGMRADFTPTTNFSFAIAETSILGGQGHMLSSGDYADFISGKNTYDPTQDKWDSIAGGDFRWRLPKLNGLQLYGEFYGEDQSHIFSIIPVPSENAELLGIYIPRLTPSGNWDLHVEWAHTRPTWYIHSAYTDGYTYKGDIIGDAMGNNAYRYYVKFTHFLAKGSQISLNAEHLSQQSTLASITPQNTNSIWIATRQKIQDDMFLSTFWGISNIKNKNYRNGDSDRNFFTSVTLIKQF